MTPLQFQVIILLFDGPQTGPDLRRRLESTGTPLHPAPFSRLMKRMLLADYVHALTDQTHDGERLCRPRRFQLTDLGLAVWLNVRDYFARAPSPPHDLMTIPTDSTDLAHLSPKQRRAALDQRTEKEFIRLFDKYLMAFKK